MEELLIGSLLIWFLSKKKTNATAPGSIPQAPAERSNQALLPNNRPVGPQDPTGGAPGGGRPGTL
jgi:hypothetical protein